MKLITLEEHIDFNNVEDACKPYRKAPDMTNITPEMQEFYKSRSVIPGLNDLEDSRIDFMDRHEIDMQVLSFTNTGLTDLPDDVAVEIHKFANEQMAEAVAKHPDRFVALAALPMGEPKAAAKELERAVKELGMKGALLGANFHGHFYDEPQFLPVFETAAKLGVPLYFHPSMTPKVITDHYYTPGNWSEVAASEFGSAGFGWHLDVGIQMVRMVLAGIFDKLPSLQLISGHWGEVVAFYLERMDQIMTQEITGLDHKIIDYYRNNIFITPSGILSEAQLKYCIDVIGADRIMYAIDYPYIKPDNAGTFLDQADISATDKAKIGHENAEKLLKL